MKVSIQKTQNTFIQRVLLSKENCSYFNVDNFRPSLELHIRVIITEAFIRDTPLYPFPLAGQIAVDPRAIRASN